MEKWGLLRYIYTLFVAHCWHLFEPSYRSGSRFCVCSNIKGKRKGNIIDNQPIHVISLAMKYCTISYKLVNVMHWKRLIVPLFFYFSYSFCLYFFSSHLGAVAVARSCPTKRNHGIASNIRFCGPYTVHLRPDGLWWLCRVDIKWQTWLHFLKEKDLDFQKIHPNDKKRSRSPLQCWNPCLVHILYLQICSTSPKRRTRSPCCKLHVVVLSGFICIYWKALALR